MVYFLGVDVGGSNTRAMIANQKGEIVGFAAVGPGNHETVGYDGLRDALKEAVNTALNNSNLKISDISGAGFGVAGYDWPSERQATLDAVDVLGLTCPMKVVNDAVLGLAAGSPVGWGINLIAGTSNNCYGRDLYGNEGRVTGAGMMLGEFGGAEEIVLKAVHAVNYEWIKRGPKTALTQIFMEISECQTHDALMEKLATGKVQPNAAWVLAVIQVAEAGDAVAGSIIKWAGTELGELASAVIRQLKFETVKFDLVMAGSIFKTGEPLINSIRQVVQNTAPLANMILLDVPPVVGAVLLGAEALGYDRQAIFETLKKNSAAIS